MIGSLRRLVVEPTAPVRRRLRARVDELSRDFRMLKGSLLGDHPTPFREGRGGTAVRSQGVLEARVVQVAAVIRETADCVSLVLEDSEGAPFLFAAGQFFTIVVRIAGNEYRRAYSASSASNVTGSVTISVKRVDGGVVSNFLHDHVECGTTLELLGPSGDFVLPAPRPGASTPRTFLMIAGGSGITPVASILRTALAADEATRFVLVYGSRSADDVIFARDLDALAQVHTARLKVAYVLANAATSAGYHVGMLDREGLAAVLDAEGVSLEAIDGCYVCGPEQMMDATAECLVARGLPAACIKFERFLAPHAPAPEVRTQKPHQLTVKSAGHSFDVVVQPGQTLLEAALAAGAPLPFSCTMGGCGACKVKKLAGHVVMAEPNCLTAQERANGAVLACVACAAGDVEIEVP
jgi:ferredoxin-NADP reductase